MDPVQNRFYSKSNFRANSFILPPSSSPRTTVPNHRSYTGIDRRLRRRRRYEKHVIITSISKTHTFNHQQPQPSSRFLRSPSSSPMLHSATSSSNSHPINPHNHPPFFLLIRPPHCNLLPLQFHLRSSKNLHNHPI